MMNLQYVLYAFCSQDAEMVAFLLQLTSGREPLFTVCRHAVVVFETLAHFNLLYY